MAARKHHHKYECQTLSYIKAAGAEFQRRGCNTPQYAFLNYIRLQVRLLGLYDNKTISPAEWEEFRSLRTAPEVRATEDLCGTHTQDMEQNAELISIYA